MNKQRRQQIKDAIALIEEARAMLECVMDEEQEAFDNLPESFQYSERGEQMEENISIIEDFLDNINTEDLEEI